MLKMRYTDEEGKMNLPDDWDSVEAKFNAGWRCRFLKRHSEQLASRKPKTMELARVEVDDPADCDPK